MSATGKRQNPGSTTGETIALVTVLAVVIVGGGAVYEAAHLGARMAGTPAPPAHPAELIFGLIQGEVTWPMQSTVLLIVTAAVVLAMVITVAVLRGRRRGKRSRVDSAATHMGRGQDIADLAGHAATEKAKRLGVDSPGVPIGRTVATNAPLYGSWEDMHVDVLGATHRQDDLAGGSSDPGGARRRHRDVEQARPG